MIIKRHSAQRDLIHYFAHLFTRNPAAAERFLKAAEDAFKKLEKMPEMGHLWLYAPPHLLDVRVWPLIPKFSKYLVFYRPIKGGVEILHVFHSSQDITTLLEEDEELPPEEDV